MAPAPKQPKSPRQKHVPQRTCIACRRVDPKRALVRVVRGADGRVSIDPKGKLAGRGAYLCHDPACWEQALRRRALERALKLDGGLHPDDRATLEQFAGSLPPMAQDPDPEIPSAD